MHKTIFEPTNVERLMKQIMAQKPMYPTPKRVQNEQIDESYFDKPRIILHTKTMLAKLRRNKVLVDDVVLAMTKKNIPMTRARFEDLFTTRPKRVTIASPHVFLALVTVCFAFDNQVLSAAELIDFADAARLPLSMYDDLAIHFTATIWQEAWYAVVPSTHVQINRHALVHRVSEFNRLLTAVSDEQSICISGAAGIGKTALATALIIELEMLTNARIPMVQLTQPISSSHMLLSEIARAYNTQPLHDEPIALRMQSIIPTNRITYLGIDIGTNTPTGLAILAAFLRLFPTVRLILTVQSDTELTTADVATSLGPIYVEHLKPLNDATMHAPAMLLMIQTLHTLGAHYDSNDSAYLLSLCQSAHGNPRMIKRVAQHYSVTAQSSTERAATFAPDSLSLDQLTIMSFFVLFEAALSHEFVQASFAHKYTTQQFASHIERLLAHSMIETVYSNQRHSYIVPPSARVWFETYMPANHSTQEVEHNIGILTRFAASRLLTTFHHISRHDALAVIACLSRIHTQSPQFLFDVARCLGVYLEIWLHHDVASHVIVLTEDILLVHHVIHPVLADLCILTARIYLYRGQVQHAQRLLDLAAPFAVQATYPLIWAKSTSVSTAIALLRPSQDSSAQSDYHDIIAPMRHAIAIFVNEEQHDWHAYAHTILTDNALYRRDLTAALQANRAARAYGLQRPNTIDYLQSQLKYSLLHFYEGSYDLSEALLTKLREEIRGYDIPIFVARIDMRLAAIAALQHQPETAERLIAASYGCMQHSGQLDEVLLVADIYSFILLLKGDVSIASKLNALVAKVRSDANIGRVFFVEQLVARIRSKVPSYVLATQHIPADDTTIYDVLALMQSIHQSTHTDDAVDRA
jgi:hypothetical protein